MPQTDRLGEARRILVYGVTGSGKSTVARRLAAITGIPATSVDDLTWSPGWVQMPEGEQRELFGRLVDEDEWILDSAYGIWRDLVLARADLVVGLDLPRRLSLARLGRRTVGRILDGREICNGNRETWRSSVLSRDAIVFWHFKSFAHKRRRMRAWAAASTGPAVVLLSRPAEVADFLARETGERSANP